MNKIKGFFGAPNRKEKAARIAEQEGVNSQIRAANTAAEMRQKQQAEFADLRRNRRGKRAFSWQPLGGTRQSLGAN